METQNQTVTNGATPASAQAGGAGAMSTAVTDPVVKPVKGSDDVFIRKIAAKIESSDSILVALSRDPSVDEMAAAIGLTLFLDSQQKHSTAIYSGMTPDALQFLQPEGTFEKNTDSLQDFIIALDKEKADHLRYGVDGDFVKVYIAPYKSNISEKDLKFSYGDFNVNLVLALGVPTVSDLDSALKEHGRIMHDATTVDITVDEPGKFAEIEWSNPAASSVSEMVTKLIFAIKGENATLDSDVATALLTGIVAATGRFSNDRTSSETMQIASKLMEMGADQQLISVHVMDNGVETHDDGRVDEGAQARDGMQLGGARFAEGAQANLDVTMPMGMKMDLDGSPEIELKGAVVTPVMPGVEPVISDAGVELVSEADLAPATPSFQPQATIIPENEMRAGGVEVGGSGAGVGVGVGVGAGAGGAMVNPLPTAAEKKDYAQMVEQELAKTSGPELVEKPSRVVLPPPPDPVPVGVGPAVAAAPVVAPVAEQSSVSTQVATPHVQPIVQSDAFQIPGMQ